MVLGKGYDDRYLTDDEVREIVTRALEQEVPAGKKVLVLVPDHTRTMPLPGFVRLFQEILKPRAECIDYLVALGTHPPLARRRLESLFGIADDRMKSLLKGSRILNHRWDLPETLTQLGTIGADEIETISGGLMREEVPVALNKLILDYDLILICGPTFPHEVVGFSGGNKYLFPGIAGPAIINFFHWLGAVITNPRINGTRVTPVRNVVDRAASMVPVPRRCFSPVVTHEGLHGLFFGTPEEAFAQAAELSAKVHVIYKERPFNRVLSVSPEMYDDIWTAGKCMYKLEPVVADGGELIIYAPHVTEISYTHGKHLDRIGYHVRDYFLKQMAKFPGAPRSIMAHSTHVKGIGTFDGVTERPRIHVVLATGIPEERCHRVNLGYLDPATIDFKEWQNREEEGILYVPRAGEMLYRLSSGTVPGVPG